MNANAAASAVATPAPATRHRRVTGPAADTSRGPISAATDVSRSKPSYRRHLVAAPRARGEVRDELGTLRRVHPLLDDIRDRHVVKAVLGCSRVTA